MNDTQSNQLENLASSLLKEDGKNQDVIKLLSEAILGQIMESQAFSKKPKAVKVKAGYSIEEGFTIEHGDIITFDSRDYSDQYKKGDKPVWIGTIEAEFHGFITVQTNKGFIPKMLVEVKKDNGSKKKLAGSVQALNLESMVNLKVIK